MKRNLLMIGLFSGALAGATDPGATLKSSVKSIEAGDEMPLRGEEFLAGETVQIVLQSALTEYDLRSVTAEEGGVFQIDLEIPGHVRPGEYRLVAVASDGDIAARLDLMVVAAETAHDETAADGSEEHGDGMDDMAMADDFPIERSRAGLEWGLIFLLVGLAGTGGVALLRS